MVVSEACERSGGQPMEPRVCTEGKPPQQKHPAEVLVRRFEFSTRLRIWLTRSNSRPMRLRLYIGRRASLSTYRRSFDPHGDLATIQVTCIGGGYTSCGRMPPPQQSFKVGSLAIPCRLVLLVVETRGDQIPYSRCATGSVRPSYLTHPAGSGRGRTKELSKLSAGSRRHVC